MSPQKPHSLESRVIDHEERIIDLEARLDKYDAIVTRLDVFIEMLSKHLDDTSKRVDDAIEGQGILRERNEYAHRLATFAISFASSVITGVLVAVAIYVIPLLIR